MLGFEFLENFNYPYIAKSITDFWRRWHISLSTWFRDYVYIPLGGNRVKIARHIFNILFVWFLTGFWHGAEWNFIIWGMYFAFILLFEKYVLKKIEKVKVIRHLYTMFFVIIGWVIFRSESIEHIFVFLKTMFTFKGGIHKDVIYYILQYKLEILLGLIFITPMIKNIINKMRKSENEKIKILGEIIVILGVVVIFALVIMTLLQSTYNPFIYFRF